MAANIAIKVTNRSIQLGLKSLIAQLDDMTPVMRAISETMLDSIEEALESEADPETGAAWQALSAVTIAAREKSGTWPGKMLQVSQAGLAASMSADHSASYAAAGSNKPYAGIHHKGGQAGRNRSVTIPARPWAGLTPAHAEETLSIIARHIRAALR